MRIFFIRRATFLNFDQSRVKYRECLQAWNFLFLWISNEPRNYLPRKSHVIPRSRQKRLPTLTRIPRFSQFIYHVCLSKAICGYIHKKCFVCSCLRPPWHGFTAKRVPVRIRERSSLTVIQTWQEIFSTIWRNIKCSRRILLHGLSEHSNADDITLNVIRFYVGRT
jgi:hypothetical protein